MDNALGKKPNTIPIISTISKENYPNIQRDIPGYGTVPTNVKCSIITMNNRVPIDGFLIGTSI